MLKLGTQTGSMTNHLMSHSINSDPVVGMSATLLFWSDRSAATVQEVTRKNGKMLVTVTRDKTRLISGSTMSEDQEYEHISDPSGQVYYFMKYGEEWCRVYHKQISYDKELDVPIFSKRFSKDSNSTRIMFGHKESYRDPYF